jgi:hypothetical protein
MKSFLIASPVLPYRYTTPDERSCFRFLKGTKVLGRPDDSRERVTPDLPPLCGNKEVL